MQRSFLSLIFPLATLGIVNLSSFLKQSPLSPGFLPTVLLSLAKCSHIFPLIWRHNNLQSSCWNSEKVNGRTLNLWLLCSPDKEIFNTVRENISELGSPLKSSMDYKICVLGVYLKCQLPLFTLRFLLQALSLPGSSFFSCQ